MSILNITNGDVAADLIKKSIFNDEVIAWRDILFEGPVPGGLDLNDLSLVRARYLSEMHYGDYETILQNFTDTNKILSSFKMYDEIILWFEHDLYDQLQLIQILNWFSQQEGKINLQLICINNYEGIEFFRGLGQLSVKQLENLYKLRQPVSPAMLALSQRAWNAFTSSDPMDILDLINTDVSALSFLKNAFIRHLQEFPAVATGLSLTENFILESLKNSDNNLGKIFQQLPIFEGTYYMGIGDTSFLNIVRRLANLNKPLLTIQAKDNNKNTIRLDEINASITDLGLDILNKREDLITINGIDCWRGGVHLTIDSCWRWDNKNQQLLYNDEDK